jgi:putative CocE/NonD family hydrolase
MALRKISRPGEYKGYSEKIYSEVVRSSCYIYIRGNNLAIDIYRPAKNGKVVDEPYPAILQNRRYQRRGPFFDPSLINDWVEHGYVVAVLDPRGAGASFGYRAGDWSWDEALDAREVIEWLASRPYCTGKVGMWGFSYMANIQFLIAATRPPHLVAIIPEKDEIDQYFRCPNGVVWTPRESPQAGERPLDMAGLKAEIPQTVDEDPEGTMLTAAVREHEANIYTDQVWEPGKTFRNQYKPEIRNMNFITQSAITYKDDIKASGVAIYSAGGWFDTGVVHALAAWTLWGGKVIIGSSTHRMPMDDIVKLEHLRWFDYHLKGIDNGIMNEPPIYYHTINAPTGHEWQFTSQWPLSGQQLIKYYFDKGRAKTSDSANDGSLETLPPAVADARDRYTADYSVKVFEKDGVDQFKENERKWDGDLEKSLDSKGVTFTSAPIKESILITGIPAVHLWASSTSTNGYFFAFLEEVDGKTNVSHYVTNGMINASCRALSIKDPWSKLGIPYHRCYDVDAQPLVPDEPAELIFDMYPISYMFRRGNRIRVTLTCSLQSVYSGMMENPPPQISVYRETGHLSYIELPVIPQRTADSPSR